MDADLATVEKHLAEGKTVIVDFYATWCGPCKSYTPKFARIEREMRRSVPDGDFVFLSVDIDRQHALSKDAGVMSVPTTVAWRMGKSLLGRPKRKEVLRFSGDRSWPELVRTFGDLLGARR